MSSSVVLLHLFAYDENCIFYKLVYNKIIKYNIIQDGKFFFNRYLRVNSLQKNNRIHYYAFQL